MTILLLNDSKVDITGVLQQRNIRIWSSINDVPTAVVGHSTLSMLERVDAVILELSEVSPNAQYILAQAIILQKPTLCLYPKQKPPRDLLNHLVHRNIPKMITTRAYTTVTVQDILANFLESLQPSICQEIPNIKFTLRLTPSLERYLQWLTDQKQINKAEFIRDLLKKQLESDQEYKG